MALKHGKGENLASPSFAVGSPEEQSWKEIPTPPRPFP